MKRLKLVSAALVLCGLGVAMAGCHTTVVKPTETVVEPQPQPQPEHHDDHHPPPPPPPRHDDRRH